MAKGFQLIPIPLKAPTVAAAGNDTLAFDVPNTVFGRIAHVAGILFRCRLTPTFTTQPTLDGIMALVQSLEVNDGGRVLFRGSFASLRLHEILENGVPMCADPDTNVASASANYFERVLWLGPQRMAGAPSDFLWPVAALKAGNISMTFGALTDVSADCTAYTGAIEVVLLVALLDNEVRVPPAFERISQVMAAGAITIPGRALYCTLGIQEGTLKAYTQLTAGKIGAVTIDAAGGSTKGVSAQALNGYAATLMAANPQFGMTGGDLSGATDDNQKQVNGGTPTALASARRDVQPIIQLARGTRISKLAYAAEQSLTVNFAGTLTAGYAHISRIVAQEPAAQGAFAARALAALGLPLKGVKVKTLSKLDYTGPRGAFMPGDVSVG